MKHDPKPEQTSLPFAFPAPPAEAPRRNLILEAGAGTGKTTSIVRELLTILVQQPELNGERVVLITFTEKAAGELSDRIREAITDLHETALEGRPRWPRNNPIFIPPASARLAEACERHFSQIERFQAQTIHAFCQRLLRLNPLEAGLTPQFAIVEGYERSRLYEATYARWLQEETAGGAAEKFRDWEVALTHLSRLDRIREPIFAFLSKRDLILDGRYELGSMTDAEPSLAKLLGDIRAATSDRVEEISDPTVRSVVSYIRDHHPPESASPEEWIEFFSPIVDPLSQVNLQRTKSFKTHLKFLRGEKQTIVDRLRNHRAAEAVRRLSARFIARLEEEKEQRGLVDFDDLLFRTATLLRQDDVLREIRRKFDYFFVDEFQDTDRIQAEIIDKLSRDNRGLPVPGRLTIVGDPKQSIYSFRRADPETYQEFVKHLVEEGAERRTLGEQYRSDPQLVENLNMMFSQLFSQESSRNVARPIYEPLSPRKPAGAPADSRVTFISTEALRKRGDEASIREAENIDAQSSADARQALAVARWIRSRVVRGSSYRGFAILLRKLTNVDIYLETLDRHGIPYVLPPTRAFLSRPAAVDLMAVLRAVAHPYDESALISAARTPYFGLSDDEIVRARLLRGAETVALDEVIAQLQRYGQLARHLSVTRLTEQIIAESEVESLYAALPGGDRSLLHLTAFRDLAAEFDLTTGGSLTQFIDELYRRREELDEAEPTWLADSEAVAVMTVHASKGLEFDTVILPDLSSRMRQEQTRLFAVEEPPSLLMTGRLSPLAAEFRESEGQQLATIAEDRIDAELDRLFYVAVTRARNDVAFVCDRGDQNAGFWRCLQRIFGLDQKGMARYFDLQVPRRVTEIGIGFEKMTVAFEVPESRQPGEEAETRFVQPSIAAALSSRESSENEASVKEVRSEPSLLDRATLARRRASARNRGAGILLHRMLELWDGREESIDSLLDRVASEKGSDAAVREKVRKRLQTIARSPHLKRLLSTESVGRELTIVYRDPEGRTTEGRIDRLIRENGAYVVVDYKSGRSDPQRLIDDRDQVRRYCGAITSMTGVPCSGVLWYVDLDSDEVVEVE